MNTDGQTGRRSGLEQEFFLVDEEGYVSGKADAFLARCREVAASSGLDGDCFSGECTFGMVEVKTGPHRDFAALGEDYLTNVGVALQAGRETGVRLYPLGTYPLPFTPDFRKDARYEAQVKTIGREKFMPAGRCIGVHMHLEVMAGVIDPDEVISQEAPLGGVSELLRLYNLMTAIDPALISLTRSCSYYEGRMTKLAARTAFYRGSRKFGWEGVYSDLPELGGLHPYARSSEDLVDRQLEGREVWLRAMMRKAGTEGDLRAMSETILDLCWRPVRVSPKNTVELRSMDGNYPRRVLAAASLVRAAAGRVVEEGLAVEPADDLKTFETMPGRLYLPDFDFVGGELLWEATTSGVDSGAVRPYLDSLFEFALEYVGPDSEEGKAMLVFRDEDGSYRTTEAEVCGDGCGELGEQEGLALVRAACDRLEDELSEETTIMAAVKP